MGNTVNNIRTTGPLPARTALACAVMLGCAMLGSASLQAAEAVDRGTTQAQALRFDIPAQPLDDALAAYGIASGVQVLYGASLTQGLRSTAVNAQLTAEQALQRLLAGTGLTLRFTDARSVTLLPAAPQAGATLEVAPVMVTGEKLDRTLEKTQTSVVVYTAETLREHGDRNIDDVFTRTPGAYNTAGNETWGLRGVPVSGFDDQGPATLNGAVSVFIDGAQQPNRALTMSPLPLWDVEQVEVLLGPQSTTQGRNSLAGAVVIQTRDPSFTPSLALQTNAGNYGERGGALAVGGALVEDRIAGRLAADYQQNDGYIDNITTGDDANAHRTSNLRGKLLVLPSDDMDLLLAYSHNKRRQGDNSIMSSDGHVSYYEIASDTKAYDRFDQDTASAKLDYRLADAWTLTSLTATTSADYDALLDFDQSASANREVVRTQHTRLFSEELRLSYEGEDVRSFIGAYYGHTTNEYADQLLFSGVPFGAVKGDTRIRNQALFGEVNWTFTPGWTLITGLRYDREQNDTDVAQDDFSTPGEVSKRFDALLPKLGLDVELAPSQYLGFMVQKGYRGGGVNVRAGGGHADYDPEYTTNYELSYRGAWFDDSLRARANLYYTDWKDQQVSMLDDSGNFFQVYNAGSSTIRGLEAFIEQDVDSRLTLNAGLAFTDGRYRDFVFGTNSDLSGESFLYSPRFKASVGSVYRFGDRLTLSGDIVYQEGAPTQYDFDSSGQVTHEHRSDDHVLVNLNAEYKLIEGLALSGYVKNLFDEKYVTNNRAGEPVNIIDVGAPRTLGLVLRYDL